jgi:transketolase
VAIVDRNGFQANVATEALIPLEPLEAKWKAFGWQTVRVDGHDFTALEQAFSQLPRVPGRPTVIIADTIRGKGITQLEGRADRWFVRLSDAELPAVLAELRGAGAAEVAGPGLVVR